MRSLIGAVVWKEVREIRRDPVTLFVAVVLPLFLLYMFGSALSLDVKDVALAVYDMDKSADSRRLADAFPKSGYFRLAHEVRDEHEIGRLLDSGSAKLVLVIPADFSSDLAAGRTAMVQTLLDGSFSATAMVIAGYAAIVWT